MAHHVLSKGCMRQPQGGYAQLVYAIRNLQYIDFVTWTLPIPALHCLRIKGACRRALEWHIDAHNLGWSRTLEVHLAATQSTAGSTQQPNRQFSVSL